MELLFVFDGLWVIWLMVGLRNFDELWLFRWGEEWFGFIDVEERSGLGVVGFGGGGGLGDEVWDWFVIMGEFLGGMLWGSDFCFKYLFLLFFWCEL